MADETTTPSKPAGRHNHSKSTPSKALPNASDAVSTPPGKPSQGRRGRNHNNFDNAQRLSCSDSPATQIRTGDGTLSDGPAATGSQKKGRGRQRNNITNSNPNNNNNNNPNNNGANGRASPMKTPQQPVAANGTPAKDGAYAGPAFHASPAPSALPMPKFFSRSVPANNAPTSLQSRLDQDSDSSGTSDKSDSPSLLEATPSQPALTSATPAQAIAPREHQESPLDFFFKADRAEKAKKNGPNTPDGKSPLPINGRNHTRHESNGNGNGNGNGNARGLFSMEMETGYSATPKPTSPSPAGSRERIVANRSITAPSSIPRTSQNAEPLPQALQDLFNSSRKPAQQSPFDSGRKVTPNRAAPDFHTPSPFYQPSSGPKNGTSPHTPAAQMDLEANPYYYGNRNLSPLFQAAKGDSTKRASGLRQEVASPSDRPDLPATTRSDPAPFTPSRATNGRPDASTISRNYLNSHIQQAAGNPSLMPYQQAGDGNLGSPFASTGTSSPARNASTADAKAMENDLKRLLKLQLVDT
ncbi:uncharacterized protein K452DRAFT_307645 [Aplosporella prunicola CBS 121167]|uniref:Proteophosphoglycan 5 n=1 Tax=Aplosporella prunicola CBS 121167 TaxID=1176127 RepID=A0A6A6BF58_9PEZI|nr:uncharacterized protein K452DRAFT_307645 [Aplosporella prunicola CBS 121167]KAF2142706.1 hypothetical protein K452DRAFT_307645 [Aplosporella prunicola CBS 121167]